METPGLSVSRCGGDELAYALADIFSDGKTDTAGGLTDAAEQLRGAVCFRATDAENKTVGYFALLLADHANGSELVAVAAGGRLDGADLIASVLPWIESYAAAVGASAVMMHTRRPGLVAKAGAAGFACDGYILRKKI